MMDCDLFRLLIQKYYDGELVPSERARFEAHRSECAECRKVEQDFLAVFENLDNMEYFQPSEEFDTRVMANVDTGRYRKSVLKKLLRDINWKWDSVPAWARITGSVAAAFAFFMYVFRPVYLEMVEFIRKGVIFLLSAVVLLRRVEDLYGTFLNYIDSEAGFITAARVLLGKVLQFAREIPPGYYMVLGLITVLIVYMALKLTRTSWRKGESHVGVI